MEPAEEDLAALEELVKLGLVEVAVIDEGEPSYRLAAEFTADRGMFDSIP